VTDKGGGEGVEKKGEVKKNENDWWEGKKEQKEVQKRLNHVC
jgi:hypothetical protein